MRSSVKKKKKSSVFCLYTRVSRSVPEMEAMSATGFILFLVFEDVPSVEFIHLAFTRTPGEVTVGDSGLCCRVPPLSSLALM